MHHFAKSYDNIDFLEAEDIFALALRQACIAMDHPDVLRCPTIFKTPIICFCHTPLAAPVFKVRKTYGIIDFGSLKHRAAVKDATESRALLYRSKTDPDDEEL